MNVCYSCAFVSWSVVFVTVLESSGDRFGEGKFSWRMSKLSNVIGFALIVTWPSRDLRPSLGRFCASRFLYGCVWSYGTYRNLFLTKFLDFQVFCYKSFSFHLTVLQSQFFMKVTFALIIRSQIWSVSRGTCNNSRRLVRDLQVFCTTYSHLNILFILRSSSSSDQDNARVGLPIAYFFRRVSESKCKW